MSPLRLPSIRSALVAFIAFALLLALGTLLLSQPAGKRSATSLRLRILDQTAKSHSPSASSLPSYRPFVYAPLDTEFIDTNFKRLVSTVSQAPIGRYQQKVHSMMTQRRLDLSTDGWRFHTPSGRNLSLASLQAATYDANYSVPNLAHYILPFKDPQLAFHHYLCILSGLWIMQPQRLVLWYAKLPHGRYWDLLRRNLTEAEWERRVVMVQRPVVRSVYNITVEVKEHQADVMRIEAILVLGGAYFDLDVLTLNPLEPLRRYQFTIGKELPTVICNGVFLGMPNNTVLAMWHLAYQTFDDSSWGGHSLFLIGSICKAFPGRCHVEEYSLDRPGWIDFGKVFGEGDRSWDWRKKNYAMHLFYRLYGVQHDLTSIRTLNNTFGDMARHILFGRSEPFKK